MDRLAALIVAGGCVAEGDEVTPDLERASEVVQAPAHTGEGTRDVQRAVNGVRGGGELSGSLDVFTVPDVLVLGFRGAAVDVEGPDLVVFENAFDVSGGGRFMDPAVVEVSADCETWFAFPHQGPEAWSDDPVDWHGFAGIEPVWLHVEDNPLDPLDPEAGGDRFDLADLGPDADVVRDGVACVRITPATAWGFAQHPLGNGPDIDGVYAAEVQ